MAEHFKTIRLDAVYSSSLTRARQTAAPLAAVHGLEVQPVEDIKEIAFGEWEGLTYNQINDAGLGQIDEFFKIRRCAMCRAARILRMLPHA